MTAALSVMALACAAGLTLRPDGDRIRFRPVENMTAELQAALVGHKGEILSLLRNTRRGEVASSYAQAFARLGRLYPDAMTGELWAEVTARVPDLARAIDTAEAAADAAGLAYQTGTAADSAPFRACLKTWETAWAEAIGAITSRACSDCGRTDATIMVTTDTGRFCRRCLRPSPLDPTKGARHDV
jgi:hypothetical protein